MSQTEGRRNAAAVSARVRTAEPALVAPLSDAQRRLWYMAQLNPRSPYYNITLAIRLNFEVNVPALAKALKTLVGRHEILRTTYPILAGVPVQEISPQREWEMQHTSIPTAGAAECGKVAEQFARSVARRRIWLDTGPVFQAHLLSLADDDHTLVLLTHHIATDQWSINVLTRELEVLYDALVEGEEPKLPAPKQYRDFVAWEAARFRSREAALVKYWEAQLVDAPSLLPLPYDRTPPSKPTQRGREHRFHISDEEAVRFHDLCRRNGASLFMGMFAVWAALLYRCTGKEQMFIGTTTAFRESPQFNGTLGCFVNTLAIRMSVNPAATRASMIEQSRDRILDSLAHHNFSYERLVEHLRKRHPEHDGRLINAYLQFQSGSLSSARVAARRFRPNINVHNGRAKFELMLNISRREVGLECVIEYDSELFTPRRIRTLSQNFRLILQAYLTDPEVKVKDIKLEGDLPSSTPSPAAARASERLPDTPPFEEARTSETLTPLESRLAELWCRLLLLDGVSRADDFKLLGGHSLLTAQLAWHVRQELGRDVRLEDLIAASKFSDMASVISARPRYRRRKESRPQEFAHIGGIPCHLELGRWTEAELRRLIEENRKREGGAPERVFQTARAFHATPFQFESRRPLPLEGWLPVRLGAFDCITFIYNAFAFGMANSLEEFVRHLRAIRYHEANGERLNSHPTEGNIFDFAEEALLVNGVARGFLKDVTEEVAGGATLESLSATPRPRQRKFTMDTLTLWATPKLGDLPITARFLARSDFWRLDPPTRLVSGDIILMSRGVSEHGEMIHHLGIAQVESDNSFLLQSTRHFAYRCDADPHYRGEYTGIFYDEARRQEQIGVGITGHFAGEGLTFERDGLSYYGYLAGTRRTLRDYLENNFSGVLILRPSF